MANIRELLMAFGKGKQTDIATASALANLWRMNKLNAALTNPKMNAEDDAAELGKGHEFATQSFKSHIEVSTTVEKYLSSQFAAWMFAFGLGKVVKSGTLPNFVYTCTPLNPVTDGDELPYFSLVEQMRPGAGVIVDRMHVGCAVKSVRVSISSGPGRTNARATVEIAGSGKLIEPSAVAMPAATPETALLASSLSLTVIGVDYVTLKNVVSVEMGWDNNFRSGYYPGSGTQDGYQIQGRLEIGDRAPSLSFVARYKNGSAELAKLKALTTGTAIVGLTADANNDLQVTWQQVAFQTVELGETDGVVTVAVTCTPQYHSTNGVVSAVVKTNVDSICQ